MSSSVPLLHRFLYISRLAPDSPPNTVSQILRQSRERNRADAISGALVFDGERFCQLLEGEPDAVKRLAARIMADARHRDVQVLIDQASAMPPCFAQWQSGYGDPEALDSIDPVTRPVDLATTRPPLDAFLRILPGCDMSL